MPNLTRPEELELSRLLRNIRSKFEKEMFDALHAERERFLHTEITYRRREAKEVERMERLFVQYADFLNKFSDGRERMFAKRALWKKHQADGFNSALLTENGLWHIFAEDPGLEIGELPRNSLLTTVKGTFEEACLAAITMKDFFMTYPWEQIYEEARGGRIERTFLPTIKILNSTEEVEV